MAMGYGQIFKVKHLWPALGKPDKFWFSSY